jgi:hypothetical protein
MNNNNTGMNRFTLKLMVFHFMSIREEKPERYDEFVEHCPDSVRKGKTMPYTSANGHMFSLLNKDAGLGIRFSSEVQKRYTEKLNTGHFKSYGAIMKGYVLIPEDMWNNLEQLAKYLNESYSYVMSLDPK